MPKPRRSNNNRNTASNDTDTDIVTTVRPSWDTSPNTLPAHLLDVKRWIYTLDPSYKTLIEYGSPRSGGLR